MNKFQKSVTSAIAAGALLLNGLMPVLGATHLVISGNGSDSNNDVNVEVEHSTSVTQSNSADVYNDVNAKSNTGDNKAEDNTGGEVSIETGDADSDVSVTNTLNSNSADVDCCSNGDVTLEIKNNGSDSDNDIDYDTDSGSKDGANVYVAQSNYADVTNKVNADAKSGDNKAKDNTNGDVTIDTGDASAKVTLSTTANANSAKVGGGHEDGGSLSAVISGNGADSDNEIDLDLESAVWFLQGNSADVYNDVDAEAETGDNEAEDNTGGMVSIETGDAEVEVAVDNLVNFNWADGDCGCLLEDLLAKIADNGADSDNKIEADLEAQLGVEQANGCETSGFELLLGGDCELENKVDADADSGDNEVEESTDDSDEDPAIDTGDASTNVELDNSGNSNVYGATPEFEFPGVNVNFSFDLNDLLGWLMGN